MWIRFESYYRHQCTKWGTGVLHILREVLDRPDLTPEVRQQILDFKHWFNDNLPAPPDPGQIDPRAIFWFRARVDLAVPSRVSPWKRRPLTRLAARLPRVQVPSDRPVDASIAAESVARMQAFVTLAQRADLHLRIVETTRPGYVIYEDDYQIAAIPFRDAIAEVQDDLID
jgi:hypothetical protein